MSVGNANPNESAPGFGAPSPYRYSTSNKSGTAHWSALMEHERDVPCEHCRAGLHRICSRPVAIPTLLTYLRGKKGATAETLTCCDRKEFWTAAVYD